MENNIKIISKENLSERTNRYLFLQCFNDIDRALNGAREAVDNKPTSDNIQTLKELEAFQLINVEYYAEAKRVFNNNINQN